MFLNLSVLPMHEKSFFLQLKLVVVLTFQCNLHKYIEIILLFYHSFYLNYAHIKMYLTSHSNVLKLD